MIFKLSHNGYVGDMCEFQEDGDTLVVWQGDVVDEEDEVRIAARRYPALSAFLQAVVEEDADRSVEPPYIPPVLFRSSQENVSVDGDTLEVSLDTENEGGDRWARVQICQTDESGRKVCVYFDADEAWWLIRFIEALMLERATRLLRNDAIHERQKIDQETDDEGV